MKKRILAALLMLLLLVSVSASAEYAFELDGKPIAVTALNLHEDLHINDFIDLKDMLLVVFEGEGVYYVEAQNGMNITATAVVNGEEITSTVSVYNKDENYLKLYFGTEIMPEMIIVTLKSDETVTWTINPAEVELTPAEGEQAPAA